MIKLDFLRNKIVYMLGLGKTGISVCYSCINSGAKIYIWDDGDISKIPSNLQQYIMNPKDADFSIIEFFVPSPGVPKEHIAFKLAAENPRCKFVSDIDLLYMAQNKAKYIGITGTNGKSTTTALVYHLLRHNFDKLFMGGNIGISVCDHEGYENQGEGSINVLELSSFQLDITEELSCYISVLLNITPDHIDRHGSLENYINAKLRILNNSRAVSFFIINIDDPICYQIYKNYPYKPSQSVLVPISLERRLDYGVFLEDRFKKYITYKASSSKGMIKYNPYDNLPGKYNLYNIMVAIAIGAIMKVNLCTMDKIIREFIPLPHRFEFVREINGIKIFNDSKSTNAEASFSALSYSENIYWIVGGVEKEGGIEALKPYFQNVKKAYLIGKSSDNFAITLEENNVNFEKSGNIQKALNNSYKDALEDYGINKAIILSPACASYDQFKNFEDRGDQFKKLVLEIK